MKYGYKLLISTTIFMNGCSAGTQSISNHTRSDMSHHETDFRHENFDSGQRDGPINPPPSGQSSTQCESGYERPEAINIVGEPSLVEASGIAASRTLADHYWVHNDSGHDPVVYSINQRGQLTGRLTLPTTATDWEDIAVSGCPGRVGSCLWIADIGDNLSERDDVSIIITPEPTSSGDQDAVNIWTLKVQYEDGPTDAEALFVSKDGSRFWIIEKTDGRRTKLYESQGALRDGGQVVMRSILEFDAPGIAIDRGRLITGADLHPNEKRLLLRVYTGTYEYRFDEPLEFSSIAEQMPLNVALGPLSERQGEAVCYSADGRDVLTISEDPDGNMTQPLNLYRCLDP